MYFVVVDIVSFLVVVVVSLVVVVVVVVVGVSKGKLATEEVSGSG